MLRSLFLLFLPLLSLFSIVRGSDTPPIQVVVFDCGGVLAHFDKSILEHFIQETFKITSQEALRILKSLRVNQEGISEKEFWNNLSKKLQRPIPDDFDKTFQKMQQEVSVRIPGMFELVDDLKKSKVQIALLSNVSSLEAFYNRENGIYSPFDPVLLSCEIKLSKPDRKVFKYLLKRLGKKGEEVLFIDDKWENVKAAQRLHIKTIWFHDVEQLQAKLIELNLLPVHTAHGSKIGFFPSPASSNFCCSASPLLPPDRGCFDQLKFEAQGLAKVPLFESRAVYTN